MKDIDQALLEAAKKGDLEAVQQCLENGADVHIKDKTFGWTALHYAAKNGHEPVANVLLYAGADIDAVDHENCTALHSASRYGHESIIRALIQAGANVHAREDDGWTALHYAARYGHESIVKTLLQAGADVNARSNVDWTVLHYAAKNGHESIVKTLVQAGAKWTPEDRERINCLAILDLINAGIAARELGKLDDDGLDSPPCSDEAETTSKPMRL